MDFQIKKAAPAEYETVISVIRHMFDTIPNKEWFYADSAEEMREILQNDKGSAYLASDAETGELAGIFLAIVPDADSPDNFGLDANLSREELSAVAYMDSVVVLPAYRGHHLQRTLMAHAEEDLKKAGYHYLFCTIHPENQYSLSNALSLDYKIIKICEKYGGYLRAVLLKEV